MDKGIRFSFLWARLGSGLRRYGAALVLVNLLGLALATAPAFVTVAQAAPRKVIVLGDSLSAGFGLAADEALTSQLGVALRAAGLDVDVPATGVSGETTTGGLARVDWLLGDKPDLMVVALGGNDLLRGIDPAVTRDNLDRILGKLKEKGVPAVLAGMLAPPNLGKTFGDAFNAIYPDLAAKYRVPLYPFLLDGVAMKRELLLGDGLHPTAAGVAIMVKGLAPVVAKALKATAGKPAS